MFDLSIIKVGLEYATFQDYRVRDAITSLVKNLEADMDEVGFDASPNTKKCIEDFETIITDIETARSPKSTRIDLEGGDERVPIREIDATIDEDDVHAIRNVDDELEEFVSEVTTIHNTKK